MPRSNGKRSNTRDNHSRPNKLHGNPSNSIYLRNYKIGNLVDVVINSAIHKGLPFKFYHGKTGKIFKVSKSSLGVNIEKTIGNRKISKKVNVRIEHIQQSKSNIGFIEKKVSRDEIRRNQRKQPFKKIHLRETKGIPIKKHVVSFKKIKTVTPEPYCIVI
mmetsp:Transcript_40428/g.80984  ORF Transcript_40428/g.80984 Transcript_40428/m.80984 type:complete len:160 (-) Transcript_40428:1390-1869(-)